MEIPKLEVTLPAIYEQRLMERFTQLAETSINKAMEQRRLSKRYYSQSELMEELKIGYDMVKLLEVKGLRRIPLGERRVLYDMEDVSRVFELMKE